MTATLDGTAEEVIVRGEVTMQLPQNGAIHTFQLTFQDGLFVRNPSAMASCPAPPTPAAGYILRRETIRFPSAIRIHIPGGGGALIRSHGCSSTSPMGIEKKALTGHCRVRLYILMLDRK